MRSTRYQWMKQRARWNGQQGASKQGSKRAYNLKLDGNDPEVEDLYRRPEHKVGLESGQVYVPELLCQRPLSSSFRNCHIGEKASQTYATCQYKYRRTTRANYHIPKGAKMSWSKATRFSAGSVGLFLVSGNALDKKPNHWNCTGAMKKPYAMKRVRRSKSNDGGELRAYPSSPTAGGCFLSKSLISIEMKSSP